MRKLYLLAAALMVACLSFGQPYHSLTSSPFTQNWSTTSGFITTNDNWSSVPSVIGYLGQDITTATGANPQLVLGVSTVANDVDVIANQTAPNTLATGGVAEFEIANPTIALQGSGTADAPHIILYLNSTGTSGIRVRYQLRDIDGSADNAVQPVALQYRIGNSGNFINVPAAFVADATTGPSLATAVASVDVTLPAAADNQAQLQVRIITTNAAGNDEWVGVDDINISANNSSADFVAPTLTSLSPADGAVNVAIASTATITFSETVQKGTGNIYLKKGSDNSTVATLDVTSPDVTVSGTTASFAFNLINSTGYYVQIDAGAFKDIAGNNFTGITDATTWNFTTVAPPAAGVLGSTYSFNVCSNLINDGFKTFSKTGPQVWTCSKFGRTYTVDPSVDSALEMNGFASGNQVNEDWLISPKFDLTGTTFPLLDFWSRARFSGPALELKISTNYAGSGDPTTATWTTLFARLPQDNSNVWTLSDSINLSAFKGSNVHIAWVYNSTAAGAARWTLDDVTVYNSNVAPAPSLTIGTKLVDFRQVDAGSSSSAKPLRFWATDFTTPLTITAPAGFALSKDGIGFSTSITFSVAELSSGAQTAFVQFAPHTANSSFSGELGFSSEGVSQSGVSVKGNSYPFASTLNVVNWNIEWFGSTGNGPSDENLQQANAKKIMDNLDADVYALAEIVSPTRLANLTASLNGGYSYVIGEYCSGGTSLSSCNSSQKLALVYKTSVLSNVRARPLLASSATARTNWASGRFPFLVTADATKNGLTKTINFIVLHGKANTGTTADQIESYFERKAGVQELKDTLDQYFPNANVIILGDFNDDLDRSIAPTTGADQVSSYQPLIADSTDADSYRSITLPLSLAGLSSTTSNPEVIDHVVISNELSARYVPQSATLFNDIESVAGIVNFDGTTSDHYPIMTRYVFCKLACLKDTIVKTDAGKCGAVVNFDLASITCGNATASMPSGSFFPVGTTTVTVSTNYGETCSFTVTVEDKEAPVIKTKTVRLVLDAAGSGIVTAEAFNNGSEDGCGIQSYSVDKTTFDCSNLGENNLTLTVTDLHGNSSTATVTLVVADETAPVAKAKNITLQLDSNGVVSTNAASINDGSTDNCGIESYSLSKTAFDCSNVGSNEVVLTVTDRSGNKNTATAVVTVEDRIAPAVSCVQPFTVNPTTLTGTTVQYTLPTVRDNCGTPVVTQTAGLPSGALFPIGSTTNTFVVTDASGNTATCSFTVTVRDPYCDNNSNSRKALICRNGKTQCISVNAVETHLRKGALLGRCEWYSTDNMMQNGKGAFGNAIEEQKLSLQLEAYPNPMNGNTQVRFVLPQDAQVSIALFDAAGRQVAQLVKGNRAAGVYVIAQNTSGLSSGLYHCRMVVTTNGNSQVLTQKLIKQ